MKIVLVSDKQTSLNVFKDLKNEKIRYLRHSNAFVSIANDPVNVVIIDKSGRTYSDEKYLATKIHSFFSMTKMPMPKFVILKHGESELSETESMFCDCVAIGEIENYVKNLESTE